MKRYGNLYSYITHINNLKIASHRAKKGKRKRNEIREFEKTESEKLLELQKILKNREYASSEYSIFTIEDKGKEREIADLPFYPDRIVHWAVMNHIEDKLIKTFIPTTYAAIPDRGVHLALDNLKRDIMRNPKLKYCLKLDIKKFFPNIDKEILKKLLRKKFKDKDLLWLLDEIVDGYKESGIPIGNYTSQYFGNFYLAYFDHWIKEQKKCRVYHRYMDDMIILGESKEELWELLDDIREYLRDHLNLEVKENYQIFPISARGVDFVGYKSYGYKTTIRNETKRRMMRKTNKMKKKRILNSSDRGSISAYNGIVSNATGKRLFKNHLQELFEKIRLKEE